jgi:hypothetical protein
VINFAISHYLALQRMVLQEVEQANFRIERDGPDAPLGDSGRDRIRQNLHYILEKAQALGLTSVQNRIERIFGQLRLEQQICCAEIQSHMAILLEALEDDTRSLNLFSYPASRAKLLLNLEADWAPALTAFPEIKPDVQEACDLYALGKNTACAFHAMRVLERGMVFLAASLGVHYQRKTWQLVLAEIDSAIRKLQALPELGPRSEELNFYAVAAREFFHFKDGWRNYVSHGADAYDEISALKILEHVRVFMNHLAAPPKIAQSVVDIERGTRAIG